MNTQDRLAEDRERWQVERLERELADEKRVRANRKAHALTGGITLLIFLFVLDLISLDFVNMINPVSLILKLFVAALFGLPTGYLISIRRGGIWRGAVIGAGVFMLVGILLGLPKVFSEGSFSGVLGPAFILALLGIIPGVIIGIHVEQDQ